MTRMQQIISLASEGHDNGEIARQVGCRREYVRVARRRARLIASRPRTETLQQRIEALYAQDLSDTEIAAELGCGTPYVRVARQRAGLYRARPATSKASQTEAKLIKRIDRLQNQLSQVWRELQQWRDGQASGTGATHHATSEA